MMNTFNGNIKYALHHWNIKKIDYSNVLKPAYKNEYHWFIHELVHPGFIYSLMVIELGTGTRKHLSKLIWAMNNSSIK